MGHMSCTGQHNFYVTSVLQMRDNKILLYPKSAACQYQLSNKKSVFKGHPYKA